MQVDPLERMARLIEKANSDLAGELESLPEAELRRLLGEYLRLRELAQQGRSRVQAIDRGSLE